MDSQSNYTLSLTWDLIQACRSDRGAFTNATAKHLGASFPLRTGWPKALIGRHVSAAAYQSALAARNPNQHPAGESWLKRSAGQLGLFCSLLVLLAGCQGSSGVARKMTVPGRAIATATGSMLPTLRAGDVYPVIPFEFARVRPSMVIVYFWPAKGINVVHRVIAIRATHSGRALVCRGDANRERDPLWVTEDEFVGLAMLGDR